METLLLLGVSQNDVQSIFEILAGILHLGQVKFMGIDGDNDKSTLDPTCVSSAEIVADLFNISIDEFGKGTTIRHIEVVGEEMEVPLSVDQAMDVRDALAKETYSRLFLWLVHIINLSTASYGETTNTIALLDIFGFESFVVNKFQKIINYLIEFFLF